MTQPNYAEESPGFEKIGDISPDGKFGVRISCVGEPADPSNIDSSLIAAVELVSLPSKRVVMNVGQPYVSPPHLIWSKDSNWFAYYVYHRSGDDFTQLQTDELQVGVRGDVRNQYVNPVRWVKPGVLLLEQYDIFAAAKGRTLPSDSPPSSMIKPASSKLRQTRKCHPRNRWLSC